MLLELLLSGGKTLARAEEDWVDTSGFLAHIPQKSQKF